MSDRPILVGLTTYRENARWGVWEVAADLLPRAYADSVNRSGATAVLIPPLSDLDAAARVLEPLDALVVSGGADIEPRHYNSGRHAETRGCRSDRDQSELLLLEAAKGRSLPVLGICRGMQMMAVSCGGSLTQHLPDVLESTAHSPGGSEYGSTAVTAVPGSVADEILDGTTQVHCHHHQSVSHHPGFNAVAYASDGTLEAIESVDYPWLGVQWHPEVGDSPTIFSWLCVRARAAIDSPTPIRI